MGGNYRLLMPSNLRAGLSRVNGTRPLFGLGVLAVAAILIASPVAAYDVPLAGSPYFLQTSGPTAGITIGDWYTATAGGGGSGDHYYGIVVPCTWPSGTPIQVDIFSPEMHTAGSVLDEIRGAANNTVFEIYAPGTVVAAFATPAPGAPGSLLQTTYAPVATVDNYVRFYTIPAPVACGTYMLRTETLVDDDNGWRLRIGSDTDANPNNPPPLASDPGLAITQIYGTFQHSGANPSCISLYEYIAAPGSTTFHNFDLDGNTSVTYFPPNGAPVAGTISNDSQWNSSGSSTRVGNVVPVAANQVGYWRIETCASPGNQFIQEGSTPLGAFFSLPLGSTVTKTDGVTTAQHGGYLQYTITFTNNSIPTGAVAANVVIRDTIPTNSTFDSASVAAPFTGTCSFALGVVTCTVNENVAAGASGSVIVNVLVNNPAAGTTVVNNATLDYTDTTTPTPFRYPQERASDTDQLPSLRLVKTSSNPGDTGDGPQVGDVITYTLTVSNTSAAPQTQVVVNDPVPAGTTYVANSTVATGFPITPAASKTFADTFNTVSYSREDGPDNWTGIWLEISDDNDPGGGDVRVINAAGPDYLRLRNNGANTPSGVTRVANLAIGGAAGCVASLTFDYQRQNLDNAQDFATVAISSTGAGGPFTPLATYGTTNDAGFQAAAFDVTAYISANTAVRFQGSGNPAMNGTDEVRFDNVQLQNACPAGTGVKDNIAGGVNADLLSGVPPTLVQAGDNLSLAPGASRTVTFRVTVTAAGAIVNVATATSAEDPHPAQGSVRDVAITRASISGIRVGSGVVEFATSWQRGTRGFNLYSAPDGSRRALKTKLNDALVVSPRPESMTPILYRVDAAPEGPFLWIEEIEIGSDSGRLMGPFEIADDTLSQRFERVERKMSAAPRDHRGGASRSLLPARRLKADRRGSILRGPRRAAATGVKVEIAEPGEVVVPWSDLLAQGLPQRLVSQSQRIQVSSAGIRTPFTTTPAGLRFIAKDLATDHTGRNVYLITWNGAPVMRAPLSQSEVPLAEGFHRIHQNWIYYQAAPRDTDPWLWDLLVEGDPWPASWDPTQGDFALPGFVPGGGTVPVAITLVGRTDSPHVVEARINGTVAGRIEFSGTGVATLQGSISASALAATGNKLELTYTSTDPNAYAYLNYLDLGLELPPAPGAIASVSAYDTELPALFRADYLIVTHPDFLTQAEQVAAIKRAGGKNAVVVDVERAYDRYTAGIPDSSAIRALIRESRRTRTVLLIGDDTLDPADHYGMGSRAFMPSAIAFDAFTGRVISENLYADRDGDGSPDVAIGRFPVRTAADADVMVQKVENGAALLASNTSRHVIAVDNQGLNDMPFRSEGRLIESVLGGSSTFADIATGAAGARTALLAGMNLGAVTTNYVGHGGPDHWADEAIFGADDAADFANTNQGTLLLTWACVSSDYRYFYGPAVSEAMVMTPAGGAVASFGPTGLSLPTLQRELHLLLYPRLLEGLSLGEAVREAKAAFLASFPGERDFLHGWALLGDPDVRLPQ